MRRLKVRDRARVCGSVGTGGLLAPALGRSPGVFEWRPPSWLVLVFVLLAALPAAALEVPYLSGRVVDEADLVPPEAEARISQRLAAYEAQTGTQVAVLTVPSLEGEPIEDYSMRVVETWKLGRGEVDDGVLLLVARDDRQMRLEVGYGLEYQLTDLASRRILDEVVRPRFRQGDFAGGLEAGTEAIVAVLRGGADALPPPEPAGPGSLLGDSWLGRTGFLVIFLLLMSTFASAALTQEGCSGWFLAVFLLPFLAAFPSAFVHPLAGLVLAGLWLLLFVFLRLFYRNRPRPRWLTPTRHRGGGFFGGGFGGGGFRGGGFGGGGFSGGGGSFGGGGASSSW